MKENKNLNDKVEEVLAMVKQVPICKFGTSSQYSAETICEMLNTWLESPDKDCIADMIGRLHGYSFEKWLNEIEVKAVGAVSLEYAEIVIECLAKSPGERIPAGSRIFSAMDAANLIGIWRSTVDKPGAIKVFEDSTGLHFYKWLKGLFGGVVNSMTRQERDDVLTRHPNLEVPK